jgi:hypothetical protein
MENLMFVIVYGYLINDLMDDNQSLNNDKS